MTRVEYALLTIALFCGGALLGGVLLMLANVVSGLVR